jgi:AcrR family transcriptional regulator
LPTGTALQDARQQLFDAAERVLLRDGPAALTSRAVTAEAGVAKGVLHRYFEDFDAFLAELAEDRIARLGRQGAVLRDRAGTGTVVGNLAAALTELFSSVAVAIIPLIIFRDELRARLRRARPGGGVPVLAEAAAMLAGYLAAEQQAGRIAAGADVGALAPALLGAEHLLSAGREGSGPPPPEAVRKAVAVVISGALRDPVP